MEVSKGYTQTYILLIAYTAIVESVLLYNCGTWALDQCHQSDADKIDAFQRKQLRQLLGYKWYDKVTNEQVGILPASLQVVSATCDGVFSVIL